jgi:internalin A
MNYKKLVIGLMIFSVIIELGIFFIELIKESTQINNGQIEETQIKKLCSNGKYSTNLYASSYNPEATVQLADSSLQELKTAISNNNGIIPSDSFTGLECLEELDLKKTSIADISELSKLRNLIALDLSSNITLVDISPLANLKKLEVLNLNGDSGIDSISSLSKLSNLRVLILSSLNVSDITPLTDLTNLTELSLSWTKITDVAPLKNMTNLRTLYVRSCDISNDNLKELKFLTKLVVIKH